MSDYSYQLETVFDAINDTTGAQHDVVLRLYDRAERAARRFAFFEANDNGDDSLWHDLWGESVDTVVDLLEELGLTGKVSLYGVRECMVAYHAAQFAA